VNGKIVAVDERFSVAQAVAVDGGRVAATGTTARVLAGAGPRAAVANLGGRTVIPGLIDNHDRLGLATVFDPGGVGVAEPLSRQEALIAHTRGNAA
jgi:predicted amidohydrolase YtcJ